MKNQVKIDLTFSCDRCDHKVTQDLVNIIVIIIAFKKCYTPLLLGSLYQCLIKIERKLHRDLSRNKINANTMTVCCDRCEC